MCDMANTDWWRKSTLLRHLLTVCFLGQKSHPLTLPCLRLKDSNVLLNFCTLDTAGVGEAMCSQESPTHPSLSELAVLTRTREKVVQSIDISFSKNFFYLSVLLALA